VIVKPFTPEEIDAAIQNFSVSALVEEQGEDMNPGNRSAKAKADFTSSCGIGSELAVFVDEFVKSLEKYHSTILEERSDIENQMDAILSSFE